MTGARYHVCLPTPEQPCVEVWAGYQLQFPGMRAYSWEDDLAVDLGAALHILAPNQVGCLRGTYATTDAVACDVENRLFTNPGDVIPRRFRSILFERSPLPPPEPPAPIDRVAGQLHYYRYDLGDGWRCWEPDQLLATWNRVPRLLADDGSARPAWLAMKSAADRGLVAAKGLLSSTQRFGVRLVVHATRTGPRSAPAISEPLIDGVIAAFHAADPRLEVAAILAAQLGAKMPDPSEADIERFVRTDGPVRYSPAHLSAWAAQSCTCLPMMSAASRGMSRSSRTHTGPTRRSAVSCSRSILGLRKRDPVTSRGEGPTKRQRHSLDTRR